MTSYQGTQKATIITRVSTRVGVLSFDFVITGCENGGKFSPQAPKAARLAG